LLCWDVTYEKNYKNEKTVIHIALGEPDSLLKKVYTMPSKEHDHSSIVSLRLPDGLLARLERYLDWMETRQGDKSSRNQAMRQALTQWLDAQEAHAGLTHPAILRRHFHAAYTSLRQGQATVAIHRLRHLLNWPVDRFDALVEHLRATSHVVLHVGDASGLSEDERRDSYTVHGQMYLHLSWQA
jgi:hypothetical protein